MEQTRYLVVGSSHAALEAVAAIRMHDVDGKLMVATRDPHLPYSPTVLPYVVSGRSVPEQVMLRDAGFFAGKSIAYRSARPLVAVKPAEHVACFVGGEEVRYERLLLTTGASPIVPPIPGIDQVDYHVLRTLDDAVRLNKAIASARRAVVLGAGLVGMHAAENLAKAGAGVTIVEMADQLCAGYFDRTAATLIEKAFTDHGATICTGRRVVGLAPIAAGSGAILTLDNGEQLETDLLLVATGVRPDLRYLEGSGIATDKGILVDDTMRTSVADVWAAGDCAQARSFYSDAKVMNAILPDAAEQGRIAGMAMAGDPGLRHYPGGIPLNTYHFFGRHAISVGSSQQPESAEVEVRFDEQTGRYLRACFLDGRLRCIHGVNEFFDGGIMAQLIQRRVDLGSVRDRFMDRPMTVGRELMSRIWR